MGGRRLRWFLGVALFAVLLVVVLLPPVPVARNHSAGPAPVPDEPVLGPPPSASTSGPPRNSPQPQRVPVRLPPADEERQGAEPGSQSSPPSAVEKTAFQQVVEDVLLEQPNLALLALEVTDYGSIAVFQYQGDDVTEVFESAGDRGQFMTAALDVAGGRDDPEEEVAGSTAPSDGPDNLFPPYIGMFATPYGEPITPEVTQEFLKIVVRFP